MKSALSGLDIALWDIKGKKLGVPIWQLLGGKVRDRVKVYGWIGGDNPSDVVEGARLRKAQGFAAVKMNATGMFQPTLSRRSSSNKLDIKNQWLGLNRLRCCPTLSSG